MNVRRLVLIGLYLIGISFGLQAQSYKQLWSQVEQYEKADLPKSVVDVARTIYVKAEKEKNTPQMMKAFLTMSAYREAISPDSLQVDIRKLEEWASASTTPMQDKAVLYSILGERIISKDFAKGDSCLKHSLKDSLALIEYDAGKFVPLVTVGETSRRYFDDNLYELLARRAIRLWKRQYRPAVQNEVYAQINQVYQSLLSLYAKKENRSAWLLTALDAYPNADNDQLKEWIKQYGEVEVCAEVCLRLADRLYRDQPAEALTVLREAIARYPKYERINALKNREKDFLLPQLEMSMKHVYPHDSMKIEVQYRNLTHVVVELYKVNLSVDSPLLNKINVDNVTRYGTLVKREDYALVPTLERTKKEISLKTPSAGIYYVITKPSNHKETYSGTLLHLTGLQLILHTWNKQCEIVVVDKRTGHPVPNAQVVFYTLTKGSYAQKEVHTTNEQGTLRIPVGRQKELFCRAIAKGDEAMAISRMWVGGSDYRLSEDAAEDEQIRLFTDRGIYRPGQRLYYSGIVYNQQGDSTRVVENKRFTVKLLNAHRKVIGEQEVKTDIFGTFTGEFLFASSAMPGHYELQVNQQNTFVRVEEYKRPTFEVQFDSLKQVYQLGDSIELTGVARTYSGVPVQQAKVKYNIEGLTNLYWRMNAVTVHTASGETTTDSEGRFVIPVHLQADNRWQDRNLLYEITADVTSLSGETQHGATTIPVDYSGINLSIEGEDWQRWIDKTMLKEDKQPLCFKVSNSLGSPVNTKVTYQVFRNLKDENKECVLTAEAPSNTSFVPAELYALPSGKYVLKVTAKGMNGKETSLEYPIVLFSSADRKLPYPVALWSYPPEDTFDADKPVSIYFGSSESDVCLFYDVYSIDTHIESKRIMFSDSLLTFRFPYQEAYGDGILVCLAFVKDGKLYARNYRIAKPQPEKKLNLTWKTFRDRLQPGQKETWTMSVRYPDSRPAEAQLMASMYDASLDKFMPHAWELNMYFPRRIPWIDWRNSNRRWDSWSSHFPNAQLACPDFRYSTLNLPNVFSRTVIEMKYVSPQVSGSGNALYKSSVATTEVALEEESDAMPLEALGDVQLRSNFAETAFFYPQLRTNAQGEVQLEFTLPESLTKWKFMGLTHTQDMDYGQLDATITASKDFMLQPQLPRFVRVGDEVTFTASLINLTEKEIKGTVRMELFNPETDKVFRTQKKSFKVSPKETVSVAFSFVVKEEYNVLACRMVAEGSGFSDGEQRYLPVLTNKQWLTESVSLDVDSVGTYRFSLEELFNHHSKTVSHPRMLIEVTGNPAWYAVQALPVLANPENENVYAWAAAYYANTLAAYIAQTNPRIRQVIESWQVRQDKEVLQSPLQKNEELKDLLLEETPWLLEGMNETEQRQRLMTLFDENIRNDRLRSCVDKLKSLQNTNGAWSWYKGMSGNRYMTTQVVELLARLQFMTGAVLKDKEMTTVYQQAFNYLKEQVRQEYNERNKADKSVNKPQVLSGQLLRYLYICSLDKSLSPEKEVNDYFIRLLEGMSSRLTIYEKALAVVILEKSGRTKNADEFMQSIMEYSVVTKELGRFFDTPKASYSWFSYKIPTEVAALEAVSSLTKDEKVIEQMKRWLLKQKQVQQWETPIATVDAVYALLCTGQQELEQETDVQFILRKDTIKVLPTDALGYLKKSIEGKVTNIPDVVVKKESDGMVWGTVYAQFLEEMSAVQSQSRSLSVSRTLLKEGNQVAGTSLQVGDKVTVRLTISTDRDMDFVQLKDERASCMEPVDVLSNYRWEKGIGYYQVTKDASTSFFFDRLRKGTYEIEYDVYITSSGEYQQGVASIQSVYAPEFVGHSSAGKLKVK